ncbi:MAG: polysaccharide biosynthesis/export family protein, partial [Terriglobales bacterium]
MKSSVICRQLARALACVCVCIGLVFPAIAQEAATSSAPTQTTASPATETKSAADTQHAIMIGSGDLLEVSIFGVPDLTRTVRVSDSGTVYLPFIDAVKVAGMTTEQAQGLIAKTYQEGKFLRDPQVSVLIKEYATQGIAVMGEVGKPGIYPLLGEVRLFDAISAAGGTTPKAGPKVTILHRGHTNEPQVITIGASGEGASQSNVALQPGDTVIVSKAGIVYVMGDVIKPGGFVMENADSLTAMQAVALAQGTTKTAALS